MQSSLKHKLCEVQFRLRPTSQGGLSSWRSKLEILYITQIVFLYVRPLWVSWRSKQKYYLIYLIRHVSPLWVPYNWRYCSVIVWRHGYFSLVRLLYDLQSHLLLPVNKTRSSLKRIIQKMQIANNENQINLIKTIITMHSTNVKVMGFVTP